MMAPRKQPRAAGRERGSALILAILIMVIMTLLGFSYLLLADTENQIAVNEKNYSQALYVAEAGVRIVKTWFDKPLDPDYLFPDVTDTTNVDRSLRMLDHDDDPSTARVLAASGDPTKPLYRDTNDDIFEKPYRGGMEFSFGGTEDGPDLRITGAPLDAINDQFFPDFPSPSLRARITQIDVYEPPIFTVGTNRIRYGMATVKVTAGVFAHAGTLQETQVAERVVKAVLNETPYPGPGGPLQSCVGLSTNGDFNVHWGPMTVVTDADINNNLDSKQDSGMPWTNQSIHISGADLTQWVTDVGSTAIEDPWYQVLIGGDLTGAAPGLQQPWPWVSPNVNTDHSNIFHRLGSFVGCPDMDYDLWKTVAQTGGKNVYYFTHDTADQFFLDGAGTSRTFRSWTDANSTGLGAGFYFFDTADGSAPLDTDSDGFADNLTPAISLSGGTYQMVGFTYLNTVSFNTTGFGGVSSTIVPPGEPYVDSNANGSYDNGETHLNLNYPALHTSGYTLDGAAPTSTSIADYDDIGPNMTADVSFLGVVYNSGQYFAQGNATYFGSIVAKEGVSGSSGTPDIYFDERLEKGEWPPPEYELPRVIISSWETDL